MNAPRKYIGAHIDASPLGAIPGLARQLGATAFALNVADPSRWKSPELPQHEADSFKEQCALCGFTPAQILPHAGFVINLGSPEAAKYNLSRITLADQMRRAHALGLTMLNLHPGAHLNRLSDDDALARIADGINHVLQRTEGVTAVLENTAGQGSNLGYAFEHIGRIIAMVDDKTRVGACIDTAHAHAAGYDLSTADGYNAMWADFEAHVGLQYLRGMHINDSQRPAASRIDRHAPIGAGTIGSDTFRRLAQDPRTDRIPLILETPNPGLWQAEVAAMQQWALEVQDT